MKLAWRTILVGTDFSPESQLALEHAVHIARRTGARLVLAHAGTVLHSADATLAPESPALIEYTRIVAEHEAENRSHLDDLVGSVRARGVEADERLVDGFPDTGLVEAADEVEADLIAIGTHGRTGIKRFVLGSVAERVVRLSRRHVLVARDAATHGYRRVLVPTDFSPLAERALDTAIGLVADGGSIELFHAWHLPLTGSLVPGRVSEAALEPVRLSVEQGARDKAEALIAARRGGSIRFEITIVNEPPARAIADRAEEVRPDLVVMGGHGHRGLRRWILGSVAEAAVRHAPASVLVVHDRRAGSES
ncbi:MAG TPA: universal stress protein [Kofleriaceae bacterium]|nr:universal stress protein [Kofleriaceae bacterium]